MQNTDSIELKCNNNNNNGNNKKICKIKPVNNSTVYKTINKSIDVFIPNKPVKCIKCKTAYISKKFLNDNNLCNKCNEIFINDKNTDLINSSLNFISDAESSQGKFLTNERGMRLNQGRKCAVVEAPLYESNESNSSHHYLAPAASVQVDGDQIPVKLSGQSQRRINMVEIPGICPESKKSKNSPDFNSDNPKLGNIDIKSGLSSLKEKNNLTDVTFHTPSTSCFLNANEIFNNTPTFR